jgi:uncharacterized LabA/DUF88 family protein
MHKKENNFAFIDSQNLNLAIRSLGWKLDYRRFRVYLEEKYNVAKAFVFLGYVEENIALYTNLEKAGFDCIFKPVLEYKEGAIKGNCDAELVLHTMIEYSNYERAVIVTGDGDFYCLVHYLNEQNKLCVILIPDQKKYSALFKIESVKRYLRFMNELKQRLEYVKKSPHTDDTA